MFNFHNLFVNWILIIISFIIFNYNLYNLLCTFSFFNFIEIHNFYYYIIYTKELIYIKLAYYIYPFFYMNYIENTWSTYLLHVDYIDDLTESLIFSFNEYLYSLKFVNTFDTYCVYFDTKIINNNSLDFIVLQNKIFILPGETTLCFFRIINNSEGSVYGIPIYIVSPFEFSSFITKVQCFCFEEIFIYPYEIIELPILFFIDSKITSLSYSYLNEFSIEYIFFCNTM